MNYVTNKPLISQNTARDKHHCRLYNTFHLVTWTAIIIPNIPPFQIVILAYHIRVLDLDRLNPKSQNFALISTALISENSDS
ncbi:hypothetical protein L1887_16851 [Cichorium endivia]|nr:hypothetical protein L1887_16851 [Cichorium endivia]